MTVCDDTKDENTARHVATVRSDGEDKSIMRATPMMDCFGLNYLELKNFSNTTLE